MSTENVSILHTTVLNKSVFFFMHATSLPHQYSNRIRNTKLTKANLCAQCTPTIFPRKKTDKSQLTQSMRQAIGLTENWIDEAPDK